MNELNKLPTNCILIHTDGACSGNPGPGGWSAIIEHIVDGETIHRQTLTDGEDETTNNRMELTAAIEALRHISVEEQLPIVVRTDSQLVVKGMTEWLPGWGARGWRGAGKKPVKNLDLWHQLVDLSKGRNVSFVWVRGHADDRANDEADRLASQEAQRRKLALTS